MLSWERPCLGIWWIFLRRVKTLQIVDKCGQDLQDGGY